MRALDRWFHLGEAGTTVRTEIAAGLTTFLAMAYILFVQPTVLGAAGMDRGAVLTATCLASAFSTLLMGLMANYPIAVAPAMGHNFFFTFTVVLARGTPWPVALGTVAIAGVAFVLVAAFGVRDRVLKAVPDAMRHAIGVGIGLLITLVGLEWSGIIVPAPGTYVTLGHLSSPPVLLSVGTLLLIAILIARGVRGALLIGMVVSTVAALALGFTQFTGVVSTPPSLAPTLLKLDLRGALSPSLADVVFVFFLLALFDTIGTLLAIGGKIGAVKDGVLPRARPALLADALGTVVGTGLGTSTVTAYIESTTGVATGGRTGLTSVVTAVMFILSLFFYPLVRMIGGGYAAGNATLYPSVAPALVLVGVLMMDGVTRIEWTDMTEAIPAFLAIVTMPLAVSITDGLAFAGWPSRASSTARCAPAKTLPSPSATARWRRSRLRSCSRFRG